MNVNKVSIATRTILIVSAIMLGISIFVPIWRIELEAPQYPEGLSLLIYSNKLGGDVEIINGLNHYIGMQTLHAENFTEFTLLPYIISGFVILMLLSAIVGRKILLYTTFISFTLFGILAMFDFYRWNYNYGHNLDPHAAIIVPGMAYQPPLIGYKQLLNFGAYSIPDIGGWLFIATAVMLMIVVFAETGRFEKLKKFRTRKLPFLAFSLLLISCNQQEPVPIKLHKDACDFCKMTIADGRFAAELITDKGKVFKFDDLSCMIRFSNENKKQVYTQKYVNDYTKNNILINAESALFIYSPNVRSPMRGDVAAFALQEDTEKHAKMWNAPIIKWNQLSSVIK